MGSGTRPAGVCGCGCADAGWGELGRSQVVQSWEKSKSFKVVAVAPIIHHPPRRRNLNSAFVIFDFAVWTLLHLQDLHPEPTLERLLFRSLRSLGRPPVRAVPCLLPNYRDSFGQSSPAQPSPDSSLTDRAPAL